MEFFAIITFIVILAIYILPSIVAKARDHHQTMAIFMLNVMTGWTFFGWVGSLVWACTKVHKDK